MADPPVEPEMPAWAPDEAASLASLNAEVEAAALESLNTEMETAALASLNAEMEAAGVTVVTKPIDAQHAALPPTSPQISVSPKLAAVGNRENPVRLEFMHTRRVHRDSAEAYKQLWLPCLTSLRHVHGFQIAQVCVAGETFDGCDQPLQGGMHGEGDSCGILLVAPERKRQHGFEPLQNAIGASSFLKAIKEEAILCADTPLPAVNSTFTRRGLMDYTVTASEHLVRLAETKRAEHSLRHAKSHADAAVTLAPVWGISWAVRAKIKLQLHDIEGASADCQNAISLLGAANQHGASLLMSLILAAGRIEHPVTGSQPADVASDLKEQLKELLMRSAGSQQLERDLIDLISKHAGALGDAGLGRVLTAIEAQGCRVPMKHWITVFQRAIEWFPVAVQFDHGEEFTVQLERYASVGDLQDRVAKILQIPTTRLLMFHSVYKLGEETVLPMERLEGRSVRVSLRGQTADMTAMLRAGEGCEAVSLPSRITSS